MAKLPTFVASPNCGAIGDIVHWQEPPRFGGSWRLLAMGDAEPFLHPESKADRAKTYILSGLNAPARLCGGVWRRPLAGFYWRILAHLGASWRRLMAKVCDAWRDFNRGRQDTLLNRRAALAMRFRCAPLLRCRCLLRAAAATEKGPSGFVLRGV